MISFTCANCNATLRVADEKAGKKARCTKCGQAVLIPVPMELPNPFAELTGGAGPVSGGNTEHLYVQNSGEESQCIRCGSKKRLRRYECYPYREVVHKVVRLSIPGQPTPAWLAAFTDMKRVTGYACENCISEKRRKAILLLLCLTALNLAGAAGAAVYTRSVSDGSRNLAAFIAFIAFAGGCYTGFGLFRRLFASGYSGADVVAEAYAAQLHSEGYPGVCSRLQWETMSSAQQPKFFVGQRVRVVSDKAREVPEPRDIIHVVWNVEAQEYLYALDGVKREGWLFLSHELQRAY